jgi:ribonuclease J
LALCAVPVADSVRVTFLGGLGEIGRNCLALEQDGRIVVIDAGLMFPEPSMYGVDLILPDFRWLIERRDKVDGIVLTHGHEDHTGALSYLLRDVRAPLYGAAVTLGFARHRLREAKGIGEVEYVEVTDGERRKIGPFDFEFVPVTHSVPYAHALVVRTKAGTIVHSGDFKLDLTPVDGRRTDVARLAAVGDEGVALLLCESTNAEEPGFTESEISVGVTLRRLFLERPDRRMIVACFASHIHRVQQIIDIAVDQGRKVALVGRSMEANVKLARSLNLLHADAADFVDSANLSRYEPGEVAVICTGSQGEPLSALSKLSRGELRDVTATADDTVILSSHPIPGNEWSVGRVIDDLHRVGVEVIHSAHEKVHASGHGRQGELRTFHQLLRPQHFIPIHGEYRHMVHHVSLAQSMGLSGDRVLLCEDGDQVELSPKGLRRAGTVPAGLHYIDGGDGDLDERPLEERRMLAEFGVVQITAGVDGETGEMVAPVRVATRGWFDGDKGEGIREHLTREVRDALIDSLKEGERDDDRLAKVAQRTAGRLLGGKYRRQPVILTSVTVF